MIGLSFLSHWDAVGYFVPIMWFLVILIKRKDLDKNNKIKILLVNFAVFFAITLPFFIPYVTNLTSAGAGNISYLEKRIGLNGSTIKNHLGTFELYNPLLTLWVYLAGLVLAVVFFKQSLMFLIWFLVDFLLLKIGMETPKTHIYNYVIPLLIASAVGYSQVFKYLRSKISLSGIILGLLFTAVLSLLFIQSYQIFADHSPEYPWYSKKILWKQTPEFTNDEVITFGFPHFRSWKEIDKYIDPLLCKYISNESKGISQIYVKANWGNSNDCFYIVTIKRPFETDGKEVTFAGLKKSDIVYKYQNDLGLTITTVYKLK
jgi:hypothetical protein